MILVAKSCKRICFDGTFYTVTKFFISNYNICKYDHTIPIIHVLMTNKSEELYKAFINRVFEIMPDFKPNFAFSYFEIAPKMHFRVYFLIFTLLDAYFTTRSYWNRVRKSKLASVYNMNSDFMRWLRCIMAYLCYRKMKF